MFDSSLHECARTAARLFRTVRHLRPVQILWRARMGALSRLWSAFPRLLLGPLEREARTLSTVAWDSPPLQSLARLRDHRLARRPSCGSEVVAGRFTLAGLPFHFVSLPPWNHADLLLEEPLAGFEMHYQGYLEDLAHAWAQDGDPRYLRRWYDLVTSWIEENPPSGVAVRVSWSPYVISARVRNWLSSGCWLAGALDSGLRERIERSLSRQVAFLAANPECHLQGNHLWQNLCGLAVALGTMRGAAARRRATSTLKRLVVVAWEQILPDGLHEERSFAYHVKCLRDLVEVLAVAESGGFGPPEGSTGGVVEVLRDVAGRMAGALEATIEAIGALPLMNDGEELSLAEARATVAEAVPFAEAARPSPAARIRGSGYLVGAVGPWAAVFDAGRPGPDHQLGHAHADHLGFELWYAGRKLISDSGDVTYRPGDARQRYRGTAAHSTVRLDGRDSLELWGSFRVGRRPHRYEGRVIKQDVSCVQWEGAHDGYAWLSGRPVHRRRFVMDCRGVLVHDRLDGRGEHRVESYLHFHPDVELVECDDVQADVRLSGLPECLAGGALVTWRWKLAGVGRGLVVALWPRGVSMRAERVSGTCAPRQNVELVCATLRASGLVQLPFVMGWLFCEAGEVLQ